MNSSKYYAVTTMCGHVRKNSYTEKTFPIMAASGKEAAEIGRWIPRVKHHNKHAILDVKEITEDEFNKLNSLNDEDPYLHCKSIQEQNRCCNDLVIKHVSRLEYDNHNHIIRANLQFRKEKDDRMLLKDRLEEMYYYDYEDEYGEYEY